MALVAYGLGLSGAVGSGTSVFVGDITMELDSMPTIDLDPIAIDVTLDEATAVDVEMVDVDVEIPS